MTSKIIRNIIQLLSLIASYALLCSFVLAGEQSPNYWPTKNWRTASPESQGMDSEYLLKMMETIWEQEIGINGALIIRNGYIVFESNSYAYHPSDMRNIQSCTKSVTSALIGIGIDKRLIKDVHQPVLEFFPDRTAKNIDSDKQAMTLENVLTMTTGLKCRDSYRYQWHGLTRMKMSRDWVKCMIDLPMIEKPGTHFEYCNGASFLLAAILQKQTGMNALSFAEKYLFGPLGIDEIEWPSNPQGITIGWGQLRMRPRDMAKFGYLYLNDGLWDGTRIISSQWIKESTRKHTTATRLPDYGYGYQWWIINDDIYTAIGYNGQFIIVAPGEELVAVFTSSLPLKQMHIPINLLGAYILPAVKSPTPLPENPDVNKEISALVTHWQTTSPLARAKMEDEAEKAKPGMKFKTYFNKEYGFSVLHDEVLLDMGRLHTLPPPIVFERRGLRGFPVFAILVDDIPQGMVLRQAGDYMIEVYKSLPQVTYAKIKKQELIKLQGGLNANYVEIELRYQSRKIYSVCVLAYKNNKIIGTVVGGERGTPIEDLAVMAKSLKFEK
ncbi:MAG: serine hydrolase domain-containing protein [Nitrospinales bacterium]